MWKKLVARFSKRVIVGTDFNGNEFYMYMNRGVWRRAVEQPSGEYDSSTIPVEWRSWLNYSREDPPTLEEIAQKNAKRAEIQQRVRELAEEEDRLKSRAMAMKYGGIQDINVDKIKDMHSTAKSDGVDGDIASKVQEMMRNNSDSNDGATASPEDQPYESWRPNK